MADMKDEARPDMVIEASKKEEPEQIDTNPGKKEEKTEAQRV